MPFPRNDVAENLPGLGVRNAPWRRHAVLMDQHTSPHDGGEEDAQGWLLLSPPAVPERWRHRAVDLCLVPLLPEEAAQALAREPVDPAMDPEDAVLARLLAQGVTIEAIATEVGMSVRGVQYRLAGLRERFGVETTAELRGLLARWGFGAA